MRTHLLVHPALGAMAQAGGITPEEYLARTASSSAWRTAADIGAPDTRVVRMDDMPGHAGGTTGQGEIMVTVRLANGIRFISAAPSEGAALVVPGDVLPATVASSLPGRHASDVVDHAMLRVNGLVVASVESMSPLDAGGIRLRLARIPWMRCEIGPDDVRRHA